MNGCRIAFSLIPSLHIANQYNGSSTMTCTWIHIECHIYYTHTEGILVFIIIPDIFVVLQALCDIYENYFIHNIHTHWLPTTNLLWFSP